MALNHLFKGPKDPYCFTITAKNKPIALVYRPSNSWATSEILSIIPKEVSTIQQNDLPYKPKNEANHHDAIARSKL